MGIIPFSQLAVWKEFFFNKTHIPGVRNRFEVRNVLKRSRKGVSQEKVSGTVLRSGQEKVVKKRCQEPF
jgi:hypothetical protein